MCRYGLYGTYPRQEGACITSGFTAVIPIFSAWKANQGMSLRLQQPSVVLSILFLANLLNLFRSRFHKTASFSIL